MDALMRNLHLDGDGPELVSWRVSPEIPSADELMSMDPPPLPDHMVEDVPTTKEKYLEKQYHLHRYEGTEPLRQAVKRFREDPQMLEDREISIYTQVHVQGYLFSKLGAACRISFSTERSPVKVNWVQSNRLTPGTLLAISPRSDDFKSQCLVAVVAARYLCGGLEPDPQANEDDNTPPRIEIFWSNPQDAVIDPAIEMVMIEARGGYFEPIRYAMQGLQLAASHESKFDKYFVGAYRGDDSAEYLQQIPNGTATVPAAAGGFDHSQMEAFKRMTSKELAIVQGPPGTGKTYTSIIALLSLIETLKQTQVSQQEPPIPIVVAAQTNHALDQLLEHCINKKAIVARLGGRSKVDEINRRTIFNIRQHSKAFRAQKNATAANKDHKLIIAKVKKVLEMCFPTGIVSAENLFREGVITEQQFDSLDDSGEWESAEVTTVQDDSDNNKMFLWLDNCVEQDRTYVYAPPTGQTEADAPNEWEVSQDDQGDDDEKDRLQGEFISTEIFWTGRLPGRMADQDSAWYHQAKWYLSKTSNLYDVKPPQRGIIYRYMRQKLIEKAASEFPNILREHNRICQSIKIGRRENDIKVLQAEGVQVIGCTTTGLTKYRGLLAALKPRILLIEEAAETQEANITSAIYPSLDQIILVGDHQQLVPHVDVRMLCQAPYNLHVSLFERLVKLNIPYSMLRVQRRMAPAIREVVHTFYSALEDHETVKDVRKRPPVPGTGGQKLWWFQHQWPESQIENNLSFSNLKEAEMIVGFVRFLVQNGVDPRRITVLTYYKGQLNLIQQLLRRNEVLRVICPEFRDWSVRTVDGFQGEENDVILLSLVRSPQTPRDRAKTGFVEDENRAVVALSRARCGMYVFGNSQNLLRDVRSQQTWQKVYDVFERNGCLDYRLPVVCKNHDHVTNITDPHEWERISAGGCSRRCDQRCPEGHPCLMACHPASHDVLKCRHPCEKKLSCGHGCGAFCGDICKCLQRCNQPVLGAPPGRPSPEMQPPRNPQANRDRSQISQSTHQGRGRGGYRGNKGRGGRARANHGNSPRQHSERPQLPQGQDVLETGFLPFIAQQNKLMEERKAKVSQSKTPHETSIWRTDPLIDIAGEPLGEKAIQKWSPEDIEFHEQAMIAETRCAAPSKTPPIKETYRQVKRVDNTGSRIVGPPIVTTRFDDIDPTASCQQRKANALDFAAGFDGNKSEGSEAAPEPAAETKQSFPTADDEDLIKFE